MGEPLSTHNALHKKVGANASGWRATSPGITFFSLPLCAAGTPVPASALHLGY